MGKAELIQTDLSAEAFENLKNSGELALDCEMMGLNPHRDRLCLVQIKAEKGPCILLQVNEQLEYPLLKSLLEDENIVKIFHYARLDCQFLSMRLAIKVSNIFCTKVASRMARTYTDKHGLKELVKELAGEQLDKTNQTSDWGRVKLTDNQVYYAENDVKYLFEIKRILSDMLKRENRFELASELMRFLPMRIELDRLGFGDIFEH